MVPTAAGETLVPHARLLLFEMGQAADALDALKGLKAGVARIGAVGTIARSVLPPAIRGLLAAAPALHVRLVEQEMEKLVEALLAREELLKEEIDEVLKDDNSNGIVTGPIAGTTFQTGPGAAT